LDNDDVKKNLLGQVEVRKNCQLRGFFMLVSFELHDLLEDICRTPINEESGSDVVRGKYGPQLTEIHF